MENVRTAHYLQVLSLWILTYNIQYYILITYFCHYCYMDFVIILGNSNIFQHPKSVAFTLTLTLPHGDLGTYFQYLKVLLSYLIPQMEKFLCVMEFIMRAHKTFFFFF